MWQRGEGLHLDLAGHRRCELPAHDPEAWEVDD